MSPRRLISICTLALCSLGLLGAASASAAAPIWNFDIHHNETNFPPGGTAEYWFDVNNVGDAATSGPLTLKVNLPNGLTRAAVRDNGLFAGFLNWSCPGAPGAKSVTCTTNDSIPRHSASRGLILVVNVAPGASGDLFTTAQISGGGAAPANALEVTPVDAAPAGFGFVPGTWIADFFKADGLTPVRPSGAHPDLATFAFDLNSQAASLPDAPEQKAPVESIRDLEVLLPPGFIGVPTAVGECTQAEFVASQCPVSSQVGRFDAVLYPFASGFSFLPFTRGVFNLTHPRGVISDIAFSLLGNPVHIKVSLDAANHYAIRTTVSEINETLPPYNQRLTLWGVPADPSHDSERCPSFSKV